MTVRAGAGGTVVSTSMSVDGDSALQANAGFNGAGNASVTGSLAQWISASFGGVGSLSADSTKPITVSFVGAGAGNLSITVNGNPLMAAASLNGVGAFSALVTGRLVGAITAPGVGSLTTISVKSTSAVTDFGLVAPQWRADSTGISLSNRGMTATGL